MSAQLKRKCKEWRYAHVNPVCGRWFITGKLCGGGDPGRFRVSGEPGCKEPAAESEEIESIGMWIFYALVCHCVSVKNNTSHLLFPLRALLFSVDKLLEKL